MERNPFTSDGIHDAGFAPGSDRRIAKSAGAEAAIRARNVRLGRRCPVTNRVANYELPESFVAQALPRLEALLKIGAWDQLKRTVDCIALEYDLSSQEASVDGPRNGTLAAKPVVWLGLPTRTTNIMEQVGAFTVGALVERFPQRFVGVTNCGPEAVKSIARALVKCHALTAEEAALRVQAWYAAMERK